MREAHFQLAPLSAVEGVRTYPAGAVPERLRFRHPTRTGDVVALTDPPRAFTRPWSQEAAPATSGGERRCIHGRITRSSRAMSLEISHEASDTHILIAIGLRI